MKSEKLQDAIGEVDDLFLQDANKYILTRRQIWGRWAAVVACCCLIAGGTYVLIHFHVTNSAGAGSLPRIEIPAYHVDGMGFEGLLCYSEAELENGNPWQADWALDTLPVYQNGCFDPSGMGMPYGLDEVEMTELLTNAADVLDLEILATQSDTNTAKTTDGTILPGNAVYQIRANTDNGNLTVRADGTLLYMLPDDTTLPEAYHFTYRNTSADEANAVMEYLLECYAAFLRFPHPVTVLQGDYTFDGAYIRRYLAYNAGADHTENLLNYCFQYVRFSPNDDGNLASVALYDGLIKAEKIGDYPLISVAEAQEKLLAGQYQTSVPDVVPQAEDIARIEVVYRTGSQEELLLPYYRFYVELHDTDRWYMIQDDQLKCYGAYYVPAIQEQYIANRSTYAGQFN